MAFVAREYLSRGSSSPYVARTMMQTGELIGTFGFDQSLHDKIMGVAHDLMLKLVTCQDRAEHVITRVEDGKRQVSEGGVQVQAGGAVVMLPSVVDLQSNAEAFLYSAKQALRDIGGVFEPFYGQRFDHRFQRIRAWAEAKFGPDDQLVAGLKDDSGWIERLISLRNAVEHPGSGDGTLVIEDFRLAAPPPPLVVLEPTWRKEDEPPTPIASDMTTIMDNLLTLFEDLLCDCLMRLPTSLPLALYEIPEKDRDPAAPIRLRILPRDPIIVDGDV